MIIDDARFLVIYDVRYGSNHSADDFTREYVLLSCARLLYAAVCRRLKYTHLCAASALATYNSSINKNLPFVSDDDIITDSQEGITAY